MHFDNNDFCLQALGIVQFFVAILRVANKSNDHARVLQSKRHVSGKMEIQAIFVIFLNVDVIMLFFKVVESIQTIF